ncbi:MAG: type II toxin-antitoxin system RelE/ParE family toxin [Dehalococcoidales bacterium]
MSYVVHVLLSAEKEMDKLPSDIHTRISRKIISLEDNPRPRGVKKLSGREEHRLRIGDYRILYVIDDKDHSVTVVAIGHRREVYR